MVQSGKIGKGGFIDQSWNYIRPAVAHPERIRMSLNAEQDTDWNRGSSDGRRGIQSRSISNFAS